MASNEEFNQAFARRHLHRVKVLSLCLPQKAWPAFAETLASSEWGWLEKLDIDLKERHPAPFRTLRPVNAPSLYYLKMRNCSIPFTTPNLTHLDFTLDGGEEESLPTPDELIMMLNQCRGLETLRLWKTVPDMTQRRDKRLYATLPYLSKLTLCSSPQRIEALAAQMIFPNWTHITLDLNYIKDAFPSPETDPKDADKITLEQGISTVETIRKRVELYGYDAGFVPDATGMILHPSRDNRFAFFDDDSPDDAFLDVTMHKTGRAETESLVDFCRTLHARFNLSGITRAAIGSRYESEEDWKEIYLLFPNIVDLKVDEFGNHSSIPAIETLEPVSPPDTMELDGDSSLKSEQKGLVPLPFLAVLRFQSVYYRLEDDNKHFNRLEKILKARATIGASLHKLDIGRFNKDSVSKYRRAKEEKIVAFRQELLDRLGKIVPEVVGDPRLDLPKWALLDDDLVEDEEDENDEEESIADSYY
ncbi:hypothetical protein OF83DRAFT_923402 [Amylostereum chailletii]|nr:hypothetical protein OF83DRAFT_923402 [Amylostereum chailletii]